MVYKTRKTNAGFTLVELAITVAILGLIGAIAAPLLLNALPEMRLKSATRDIYSLMMRAKLEAIKRGQNVIVAFSIAADVPPNGNSPANSYAMCVDTNNNVRCNTAVDTMIVLPRTLPDRVGFDTTRGSNAVTFAQDTLVFTPRGTPVSANAPAGFTLGSGSVFLCTLDRAGLPIVNAAGNATVGRSIVVSAGGRVRTAVVIPGQ
jgi:prepilin-type N-terminal cleavage/methylation domain-containing protein